MVNTIPHIPPMPQPPVITLEQIQGIAHALREEVEAAADQHPRVSALGPLISQAAGIEFNLMERIHGGGQPEILRAGYCIGRFHATAGSPSVRRNATLRDLANGWQSRAREILDLLQTAGVPE